MAGLSSTHAWNMSPAEREFARVRREARAEQDADDEYRALFDAELDRRRAEWVEHFDAIPFKPDQIEIHRVVMRQIAAMAQDE
jgi:hypothetical protein